MIRQASIEHSSFSAMLPMQVLNAQMCQTQQSLGGLLSTVPVVIFASTLAMKAHTLKGPSLVAILFEPELSLPITFEPELPVPQTLEPAGTRTDINTSLVKAPSKAQQRFVTEML